MLMKIIEKAVESEASDIHLTHGAKPFFRIHDVLRVQNEFEVITDEIIMNYINELVRNGELETLKANKQLDFAIDTENTRCRVNIFKQKGHYDIAIRLIDYRVKSLEELGLNEVLKTLASLHSGLVLVTGVTGSGKSTTLAAMIDYINANYRRNIITLEDPIEYVHELKKSIIRQREIGADVISFAEGLKSCLREDPDVILVGELRDLETISSAVTLAETGHLVLATLHTRNAPETIDRIIDVFPPSQQQQIRVQLANVLEGIISQILIPRKSGGRTACMEIMRTTVPVRSIIRTNDHISKIRDEIFFNKSKLNTQTMTQGLVSLFRKGIIEKETALKYTESEEMFNKLLNRGDSD